MNALLMNAVIRNLVDDAREIARVEAVDPRVVYEKVDAFDLPDKRFVKLFRLNKITARHVINLVEQDVEPSRASAIDATTMVSRIITVISDHFHGP